MATADQSQTLKESAFMAAEISRIRRKCEIPADCTLELLESKYEGWEENPNFLPADSIVIFELHLQNLGQPFHPFYQYIFAIHDLHPLQVSTNSIRTLTGFILISLIRDLKLEVEDFHYCFSKVRSG